MRTLSIRWNRRSPHTAIRGAIAAACCAASLITASVSVAQTCLPPANGRWPQWLAAQEDAGGHTLACHVGVSENGLIGRLTNRGGHNGPACAPNGNAASAWSGLAAVLDALRPVIQQEGARYANGAAGDYVIDGNQRSTVGTVVSRSDAGKNRSPCQDNKGYVCQKTSTWVAIVRKTANDCYLLTAYPR
jgi:hypothetical protein